MDGSRVTAVGLGAVGAPIVRHLAGRGQEVVVHNARRGVAAAVAVHLVAGGDGAVIDQPVVRQAMARMFRSSY